jgi:hypothetical protein
MSLAALERKLRSERALTTLAQVYVHRVVREDSLGFIAGRDAILADWVNQERAEVTIQGDFGDMIAVELATASHIWPLHRWVTREDGNITAETLIEDKGLSRTASPVHPPLGELRAARGQFDAGSSPVLPSDFCQDAIELVTLLHKAWNGRAFDLYDAPWLGNLLKQLPDATFYFERALVAPNTIAVLWRVHGHHADGQRIRLIGSSVMGWDNGVITSDLTCLDQSAFQAQLARETIDYS